MPNNPFGLPLPDKKLPKGPDRTYDNPPPVPSQVPQTPPDKAWKDTKREVNDAAKKAPGIVRPIEDD